MFDNCRNSKKQGDVGLGYAISWFTKEGYTVCVPLTDSDAYDLIVEKDGVMSRVQVKTTTYKTQFGIYQVALKTSGGNQREYWAKKFDATAVEFLAVLTNEGTFYVIPCSEIVATTSLNLGKQFDDFRVCGREAECGRL